MQILQAFRVVGRGPTGTPLFDVDETGVKDIVQGSYFSAFDRLNIPLLATSVDSFWWVCQEGTWRVASVAEAHTVVGGSGATVNVVVCPQAVAIASGTAQLSAALDLTVTAPAKAFGTLIASPTDIRRGDCIGIDMSGTLTGLVGILSIMIKRVS